MSSRRIYRRVRHGWASGLAGTAAMTTATRIQQRVARGTPVDYDASHHVVDAAATVLRDTVHWTPSTDRLRTILFNLVHWCYGSSVACAYPLLTRRLSRRAAAVVFYAGCQTMAFPIFPMMGGTAPPWRWPRKVLVSHLPNTPFTC